MVEGWRRSSHSYALVNQHQLLCLAQDSRFRIFHVDIPFDRAEWAQIDTGFGTEARQLVDSISAPAAPADVIYRISWPLRIHGGNASRIFVFGTSELQLLQSYECCGPSGTYADVDRDAVDIITPSQWSRAGFICSGFDERRVHVIPHGVDARVFRPPSGDEKRLLRAALQIPEDAFVFLNIGAMTRYKGIGPLLAAFAIHKQTDERAILLLKGGDYLYGNLMKACFAEANQLLRGGIPESVLRSIRYSGKNLSLDDVAKLYRASDAYVSSYRAEGFNLPVLEALASGLVPIATAGGPTDDFCPHDLALKIASVPTRRDSGGRFLEPNLDSIVDCMQKAAAEESLRKRAAVEGPRWVAERYTWAHVSRLLADRLAAERGCTP